jgi:hypothetical protein
MTTESNVEGVGSEEEEVGSDSIAMVKGRHIQPFVFILWIVMMSSYQKNLVIDAVFQNVTHFAEEF